MLSYRHAFHAGNHADVLKHLLLQRIMLHLGKKPTPFCCIDTHAGAGGYRLTTPYALKNKEFETGVAKLWRRNDLPAPLADYLQLIKSFNREPKLNFYPGSPLIMQRYLRPKDRLFLYELHGTEIQILNETIKADRHIQIFHDDGLSHCVKLLPPSERRGLIFIDPSYEIKQDYTDVIRAIKTMHQRFATGIYALWYPVIDRARIDHFERAFKSSGIKNIQLFELTLTEDTHNQGMTGSGMIIINPPWTLAADLQLALPWLVSALSPSGNGNYRIDQLVAE